LAFRFADQVIKKYFKVVKIIKGDNVKILSGKDRGKTGKVLRVIPKEGKVLIEGLNLVKKHVKPRRQGEKGQRVSVPAPVDASNVMLVCPKCSKPSRTRYKLIGEKKHRVCKKCNKEL
jgi:large subunit ribosomal protein L24